MTAKTTSLVRSWIVLEVVFGDRDMAAQPLLVAIAGTCDRADGSVGIDGEVHAHALVEPTHSRLEGQERPELRVGRVRDEFRPGFVQLLCRCHLEISLT
jgi:hypothetical protein